ncbi:hypothetical protein RDV89_08345 [Nocardioides zeae]|uniref:Uncharacterized protein n=1 Tax=Nocardioides imazamoxiresistens TaxID=3231893 RepID=A0ABU3PV45_9ACTN|nr:hypothetical protein [Nocardioides zeae]MDT9593074.1 hypothetical protein [Nocardioides zeae]
MRRWLRNPRNLACVQVVAFATMTVVNVIGILEGDRDQGDYFFLMVSTLAVVLSVWMFPDPRTARGKQDEPTESAD